MREHFTEALDLQFQHTSDNTPLTERRGKLIRKITAAALLCCAALPSAVPAQDYDAGLAAYEAGDYASAVAEWLPLAEHGDANAQIGLGRMYNIGIGVPQDYVEAARWYRLAAEQGHVRAQVNLGSLYFDGQGVPQDYVEAARWYRLAAEQGDVLARSNLANLFFAGRGVPQDYAEAARWLRLAAEEGYGLAQCNLGYLYYNGQGVPQSYVTAYMWCNLAAAQGSEGAGETRDFAARHLTSADLIRAQRLSDECLARNYQEC